MGSGLAPRCGVPVVRYETACWSGSGAPYQPVCGRPAGHNGPHRSAHAVQRYLLDDRSRWDTCGREGRNRRRRQDRGLTIPGSGGGRGLARIEYKGVQVGYARYVPVARYGRGWTRRWRAWLYQPGGEALAWPQPGRRLWDLQAALRAELARNGPWWTDGQDREAA